MIHVLILSLFTLLLEPPQDVLHKTLTFCATYDTNEHADYAQGDRSAYAASRQDRMLARQGELPAGITVVQGAGRHGAALKFEDKREEILFYQAEENTYYHGGHWTGTVSVWLKLDPENDLNPGYCDPFQITDVNYNDASVWVDFTEGNPRAFRMGAFGDLKEWNPDNIPPNEFQFYLDRLVVAEERPFGSDVWTHVAVTFDKLGTNKGSASLYVNGKIQGTRTTEEPFTWSMAAAKMMLGLNYIGLIDEFSVFSKALDAEEVAMLYQLPGGIHDVLDSMKK